jgi:hypothetical protein
MSAIKNISLYIPHIFANYSKEDVIKVFHDLNIGKVKNIDFISKMGQDGKTFNAAYVHFDCWYDNESAAYFQERVLNPKKEARLMYEDPWYWIVLENKARKFVPGERKPRIDLGEFPSLSVSNITPVKANKEEKCPCAPMKSKMPKQNIDDIATNLCDEFASDMEEQLRMDEIEAAMEEEDQHLVNIDSRYVAEIESENMNMRVHLGYLQSLLATEQIKSQTLAEAIKLLQK